MAGTGSIEGEMGDSEGKAKGVRLLRLLVMSVALKATSI